jgi:BirA family biotin operon repressor/biotin-[acetyl-CoA-carboxylase] ligase
MSTERDRIRHLVVGLGLNVNADATAFPPEVAARATSLRTVAGRPFDRGLLLAALLNALEPAYDRFLSTGAAEALARWRPHAALGLACRIERDGAVIEGTSLDVDDQGALLVRDRQGAVRRVLSGEVV